MRNNLRFQLLILFISCFFVSQRAHATHARAGEITAKRIGNTNTYDVTFTGYFDVNTGKDAADLQNDVSMYFYPTGSNGQVAPRKVDRDRALLRDIGNNTTINVYTTRYAFPSTGDWTIAVMIDNRNNSILNLSPAPTSDLNFFVHTNLIINAFVGANQTPILLNAPIDLAAVGQRYIHNPGAFDADGDSIAYHLYTPQQNVRGTGLGVNLGYKDPNLVTPPGRTETGASPATFSMNALTGDLIWDAPVTRGFYNVAFVVEEWRDGVKIGDIIRDMQIIVVDARNDRPKLDLIPDLCVEAGTLVNQIVKATDKNGDKLTLTSTSGLYQATALVSPAYATFSVPQQGAQGTLTGQFTWQTGCNQIRLEPYEVLFKVEDGPGPNTPNPTLFQKLVDITTLHIKVYGPQPQNLAATAVTDAAGKAFKLTWDSYKCQVPGAKIVIYRREGCREISKDVCFTGLDGYGYEEIARVNADQVTYTDNNAGAGLKSGISYSYRIVVVFPRPDSDITQPGYLIGGGESKASEQVCIEVPLLMPVITNVTVDSTSDTRGIITVKWTRPTLQAGASIPAQYKLFRATGLSGTDFTNIATINTNLVAGAPDTIYVDKNLNTVANAYRYKLEYYYTDAGKLVKLDETDPASSVRLSQGSANPNAIRLNWTANVPWSNDNQTHRVYREDKSKPGTFNRIADVTVTGAASYTYTDDGTDKYAQDGTVNVTISKDVVYCYKVETVGSYNNTQIKVDPLYNFSQIICVSASDTTKPCVPVLSIDQLDCATITPDEFCDQTSFTNNLSWTYPNSANCDQAITAYRLYYTRYEGDTPTLLKEITAPAATTFAHEGLTSFAGCYYVTAVNKYGTESAPSNTVCKDNCPIFALPNVITPNGDGKNDLFTPLKCPSFVQSLDFKVFNRWGAKVYDSKDVNINWNGKNNSGNDLAAGQYYYEVIVNFESVQREGKPATFKGWVQILR
ncbi:gliding motility-associated C-terminal domain-containing protein [Dyadobacter subterraneus]|uniref:Gliding motility-associated C-terminal domain-containing protein n=3 Tax=Dyadobacter subterraneus TaxID=2773304 RepID=A0ABR9WKQ1_9BACT|nr:gliding motility-associated C-terminal domain-containing protein [Dyadobacter subterraneus]MBE9466080.1 gliding motility-associated C-terminal domain-containing protein [Dyadobacter subterraneus]